MLFAHFSPLTVVSLLKLIKLELVLLLGPLERFRLFIELLVEGLKLLSEQRDLTVLLSAGLVE